MRNKNNELSPEFKEALGHVVKTLRIPSEYIGALEESCRSEKMQEELIAFSRSTDLSLSRMPASIKEILTRRSQYLRKLIERDIDYRANNSKNDKDTLKDNLSLQNLSQITKQPDAIDDESIIYATAEEPFFFSVIHTKTPLRSSAFYRLAMRIGAGGRNPDAYE